jgi:hypothetical protein
MKYLLSLMIAALVLSVSSPKCGDGIDAQTRSAISAKDSPLRRRVLSAARKYTAIHWPDVDLRRWYPTLEFSEEGPLFKGPQWIVRFEGRPPIHSPDGELYKFEYDRETVNYGLILDTRGNRFAATVIPQ